jgi:hypothetical protein
MKKLNLLLIVLLGFLIITCATIPLVSAQTDFVAFFGNSISNSEIDGAIGSEWGDAGAYTGVAISPQGTAEVWTKHDGVYLYIAVRFTADSDNPWVAFLFGGTTYLTTEADGAIFGHDNYTANGYSDIFFTGLMSISADASQDGTGAMSIDSSNLVTVELKKPLSSGDSAGKDIAWTEGNTYALIIMWNSNLYGASGGNVTYSDGPLEDKTIFFASTTIPEFPGLMFTVLLVAMTISAFLLNRKVTVNPTANITT